MSGQNQEDGPWAEAKHIKHTPSKPQDQRVAALQVTGKQGAGLRVSMRSARSPKRAETVRAEAAWRAVWAGWGSTGNIGGGR